MKKHVLLSIDYQIGQLCQEKNHLLNARTLKVTFQFELL